MRLRPRLPRLRTWRARIGVLAGVLAVIAGIAVAAYIYVKDRTGSVYHPDAHFIPEVVPTKPPPERHKASFVWPFYGYTKTHRRYFPAPATMRPPFRKVWENHETGLLEFPAVMSGERLFQLADGGTLVAIAVKTGKTIWTRQLGVQSASAPAVVGGTVYATILSRSNGGEGGRIVALHASSGKIIWSRNLPSRTESSPLVDGGKVFFGSESGTVYALQASTGHTIWTYQAPGAVKASPTLSKGVLYFGDYSGDVQAISERTGRRIWISGSEGAPFGSGTFYSTAAVAYGRVYLGNTDGRIYAYEASNGKLDWAYQTGAYVYASPAVTNTPGLGPTVYEGSYDGNLYAINARSGRVDWAHRADGKISGSATIIGKVLYYSDLGSYSTTGLNTTTGKVLYAIRQGAFDPGISDGHLFFLSGYNVLYAMEPIDAHQAATGTQSKSQSSQTSTRAQSARKAP